jgi:hypothetical protein
MAYTVHILHVAVASVISGDKPFRSRELPLVGCEELYKASDHLR